MANDYVETPQKTPWHQWRALAYGTLGWPPHAFWAATPHDLLAALDCLQNAHELDAATLQTLDDLRKRHEL